MVLESQDGKGAAETPHTSLLFAVKAESARAQHCAGIYLFLLIFADKSHSSHKNNYQAHHDRFIGDTTFTFVQNDDYNCGSVGS